MADHPRRRRRIGIRAAAHGVSAIGILPIVAFVAAAIYLTDVRPKVRDFRAGTRQGPYGPW